MPNLLSDPESLKSCLISLSALQRVVMFTSEPRRDNQSVES